MTCRQKQYTAGSIGVRFFLGQHIRNGRDGGGGRAVNHILHKALVLRQAEHLEAMHNTQRGARKLSSGSLVTEWPAVTCIVDDFHNLQQIGDCALSRFYSIGKVVRHKSFSDAEWLASN